MLYKFKLLHGKIMIEVFRSAWKTPLFHCNERGIASQYAAHNKVFVSYVLQKSHFLMSDIDASRVQI